MKSQPSLKPLDLILAVKLVVSLKGRFTLAEAANSLFVAPSQIHSSLRMLGMAQLVAGSPREGLEPNRERLLSLILYGVPSFYPPILGVSTRGMRTAFSRTGEEEFRSQGDVHVWPSPRGGARGTSILPIHASVPLAAEGDGEFYLVMAALDALRIGSARERKFAEQDLERSLS